ncbi:TRANSMEMBRANE PROTEIN [Salix viminalis]|uniref:TRANSMEMBRANE PROTEIN n=1 Tax=Salix viminalis TaxID=40686 RepID=A0A9Q0UJG8_SALVM|nr:TRANSMEMBRANE PROTEIN [Salix viminalis]
MSGRIFLVIFFFWALLAIVTPTLVLLSESSAPYLDLNVEKNGGGVLKPRRMMRYFEKQPRIEEIALASILQAPTPAPVPDPDPEPEPEPVSGIREVILTRFLKRR